MVSVPLQVQDEKDNIPEKIIIQPRENDNARFLNACSAYTNSAALFGNIAESSAYDNPVSPPVIEANMNANHERFPVIPTTSPISA